MRPTVLAVAGWALAGALATLVGVLAVSLIGTGITSGGVQPLNQEAVAAALAHSTASPRVAAPPVRATLELPVRATPEPMPADPGATRRALPSPGGSVVARCTGTTAYLLSWSPRLGFETEDHVRGPAPTVYVRFDSEDLEVLVTVGCRDGAPFALTAADRDS